MKKKKTNLKKSPFYKNIPPFYWLAIIAFVLYANSIKNSYNFDDNFVVLNNPTIEKGISSIPEIFTSHYWIEKDNTFGYRPIARATFAIEMSIWGKSAPMSHLVNILLYCLCIIISYKIIRRIFPDFPLWLLFLAFLLFITHPTHTEVINSLKNREDILVFLFGFTSVYLFLKYSESGKWFWLSLGLFLFFVTCLTKENGITFAAIIPIACFFALPPYNISFVFFKKYQKLIFSSILIIITGIIAIKLPDWILTPEQKTPFYFENPLHFIPEFSTHLATGIYTLIYYLKILIFPYPLLFYYGYNAIEIHTFSNSIVWISTLLYSLFLFLTFKNLKKNPLFSFSVLFYLISISVYSNIVFPVNGIVAERFVFIASLGFTLALFALIQQYFLDFPDKSVQFNKRKNKIIWITLLVSVIFSIQTMYRNTQWKDYKTLLGSDIENLNNSAKAQTSYATVLLNELKDTAAKGYPANPVDLENTLSHYRRSLEIYPDLYSSMNNIGFIYLTFYNNPQEAIPWFKKAIQTKPDYTEANYNLAYSYMRANDTSNALHYYVALLKIDSTHILTISDIANIRFSQKDTVEAIRLNKQIMNIDSFSDFPYINLGNYALLSHDTAKAVEWWEKAISKNPNNPKLCYGMSKYFIQHGQIEKGNYYMNLSNKKTK